MAQVGRHHQASGRISGQTIIDEMIRNMELGRFEMGFSVLLPCIFSVYLHPDDYTRIFPIQHLVREDARRALSARLDEFNRAPSRFGLGRPRERKIYRIARKDWWIEFFADNENGVPAGDVEIHSELNDTPQPGYRGVKTTLLDRTPSVSDERAARDRTQTRASDATRASEKILAELRYEDDSGPQVYYMTQNEIRVGRGGHDLSVDLPLYTNDEVSREHLLLRRDPATGRFAVVDQSRNGTWLDGHRLRRGVEEELPDRARIDLAEVLTLEFEKR